MQVKVGYVPWASNPSMESFGMITSEDIPARQMYGLYKFDNNYYTSSGNKYSYCLNNAWKYGDSNTTQAVIAQFPYISSYSEPGNDFVISNASGSDVSADWFFEVRTHCNWWGDRNQYATVDIRTKLPRYTEQDLYNWIYNRTKIYTDGDWYILYINDSSKIAERTDNDQGRTLSDYSLTPTTYHETFLSRNDEFSYNLNDSGTGPDPVTSDGRRTSIKLDHYPVRLDYTVVQLNPVTISTQHSGTGSRTITWTNTDTQYSGQFVYLIMRDNYSIATLDSSATSYTPKASQWIGTHTWEVDKLPKRGIAENTYIESNKPIIDVQQNVMINVNNGGTWTGAKPYYKYIKAHIFNGGASSNTITLTVTAKKPVIKTQACTGYWSEHIDFDTSAMDGNILPNNVVMERLTGNIIKDPHSAKSYKNGPDAIYIGQNWRKPNVYYFENSDQTLSCSVQANMTLVNGVPCVSGMNLETSHAYIWHSYDTGDMPVCIIHFMYDDVSSQSITYVMTQRIIYPVPSQFIPFEVIPISGFKTDNKIAYPINDDNIRITLPRGWAFNNGIGVYYKLSNQDQTTLSGSDILQNDAINHYWYLPNSPILNGLQVAVLPGKYVLKSQLSQVNPIWPILHIMPTADTTKLVDSDELEINDYWLDSRNIPIVFNNNDSHSPNICPTISLQPFIAKSVQSQIKQNPNIITTSGTTYVDTSSSPVNPDKVKILDSNYNQLAEATVSSTGDWSVDLPIKCGTNKLFALANNGQYAALNPNKSMYDISYNYIEYAFSLANPPSSEITTTALTAPASSSSTQLGVDGATVQWAASDYATKYSVYDGSTLVASNVTGTSTNISGLQPGTHTFTVISQISDSTYDSTSSPATTITLTALSVPTGLAWSRTGISTAKLTWNSVSGATAYTVSVDNVEHTGIASTSYDVSGLTKGSHTAKVKATF